jgi:hypothetical protein
MRIRRRELLKLSAAGAIAARAGRFAAILAPASAVAQKGEAPVKIGVLSDMSSLSVARHSANRSR